MADTTQPAWRGLQSLFDASAAQKQQQQQQQQAPVGGAPGVPSPYDPVTGLPTPTPPPAGAAPAAAYTPPSTGPLVESRRGIGHFGGGDTTAANNAADAAAATTATNGQGGTTPTQQGPQNYLEDAYKQLGGAYLAPSYMDSSMGGLQSQLAQPGAAEQFYQQAQNTATDPYYQRLQQQGNDALNQQMAARGSYNSGGALAALGNFNSGLAAQQYSQMGQLAQNAQNGQQQRVGLSGQLSQTADAGDLSRLNSFFGVAGQAQGANQNGINNELSQQMGISNMGSGLVGGFYGNGGQLSGQSYSDYLNGLIQSKQAQAQGQQAQQGQLMGLLGLGLGG